MATMEDKGDEEQVFPPVPKPNSWGGRMPPADGVWRKRDTDTLPAGRIWCSDGTKVWSVLSTGNPGAYSGATHLRYWMACDVPAPPTTTPNGDVF